MKKYIIIKHFLKGTYFTDSIDKNDLVSLLKGESNEIIDVQIGTYFDSKSNSWKNIKTI